MNTRGDHRRQSGNLELQTFLLVDEVSAQLDEDLRSGKVVLVEGVRTTFAHDVRAIDIIDDAVIGKIPKGVSTSRVHGHPHLVPLTARAGASVETYLRVTGPIVEAKIGPRYAQTHRVDAVAEGGDTTVIAVEELGHLTGGKRVKTNALFVTFHFEFLGRTSFCGRHKEDRGDEKCA